MNPFLIAAPAGAALGAFAGFVTGAGVGVLPLAIGGAVLGTVGAAIYRIFQRKHLGQDVPKPSEELEAGAAELAAQAKAEAERLAQRAKDQF